MAFVTDVPKTITIKNTYDVVIAVEKTVPRIDLRCFLLGFDWEALNQQE